MLDYNVPGGKLNRGMAVADVLKAVKETEVSNGMPRADSTFQASSSYPSQRAYCRPHLHGNSRIIKYLTCPRPS